MTCFTEVFLHPTTEQDSACRRLSETSEKNTLYFPRYRTAVCCVFFRSIVCHLVSISLSEFLSGFFLLSYAMILISAEACREEPVFAISSLCGSRLLCMIFPLAISAVEIRDILLDSLSQIWLETGSNRGFVFIYQCSYDALSERKFVSLLVLGFFCLLWCLFLVQFVANLLSLCQPKRCRTLSVPSEAGR